MHPTLLISLLLPWTLAAAPVGRVLDEDPPLPGEPLTGWEALEPAPPPADGLTVEQALALAFLASPRIQAMDAELSAARAELVRARALPNPSWEIGLGALDSAQDARSPASARVELDATDLALAPLAGAAARPELVAAELLCDEARLVLAYEVKAAWFDHQAALATWGAALRSVETLAVARDAQRAITAAGNAPGRDLVARELAYEQARARAAALELDVVRTREALARLLGQDPGPLAPAPALPTLDLPQDVEAIAVSRSLALQALDAATLAAERGLTLAKIRSLGPDLDLFVEAERDRDAWQTTAGLELSVPLLSFGRGEIAAARAGLDRQSAQRAQLEIEVRSSAREAAARLASAHRRARHHDEVLVPATALALHETLLHYNAMQVGLDALLVAVRAQLEIEAARAETWREALTAQAALDAILAGARVSGGRPAVSASTPSTEAGGH